MSRMNRRGFLTAAGSAAGALALAGTASGCSGDFRQTVGSVPRAYAGRTHLVVWHSFGSVAGDTLQGLVDAFNEEQNEIYVETQFQGGYEVTMQKLATSIRAKQIPDLVTLSEVTWRKMHLAGTLEPLSGYFDQEVNPDSYVDQFIDEGHVGGETWWIPFARSTPLFYYNKEAFAKAGLSDRPPKSWEEYRELVPGLLDHGYRGLALGDTHSSWVLHANIWNWGGNYSKDLDVTIDEEPSMRAIQWLVDLVREDQGGYFAKDATVDIGNGVAAATMTSTGSLTNVMEAAKGGDVEVGTGFLLEYDGQHSCPTGGSGFGIMADAAPHRKEAAWEFLKFLARPERSAEWSMGTGYLPVVKEAQQDPKLVKLMADDPNFRTAVEQLPLTRPQDLIRLIVGNGGELLDKTFVKLYSSNVEVTSTVERLASQLRNRAELVRPLYEERY